MPALQITEPDVRNNIKELIILDSPCVQHADGFVCSKMSAWMKLRAVVTFLSHGELFSFKSLINLSSIGL